METKDWKAECARLQTELDGIRAEMEACKSRFEGLLLWKDSPRLPVRGRSTLDCVGTDKGATKGRASTQTYTTIGWDEQEDWK